VRSVFGSGGNKRKDVEGSGFSASLGFGLRVTRWHAVCGTAERVPWELMMVVGNNN